jgi:hypothetical protein
VTHAVQHRKDRRLGSCSSGEVIHCAGKRVAQLGEHLLCKQSNSQAKSLPRLRLGESSVLLAAPILLQDISHQPLVPMCGRQSWVRQKIRFVKRLMTKSGDSFRICPAIRARSGRVRGG